VEEVVVEEVVVEEVVVAVEEITTAVNGNVAPDESTT
jgi:hypothetical protein